MIRLYLVVEGATEETFASELLYPHLLAHGVCLTARRIGKPGHKGGRVNYSRAKKDVLLLLKQDRAAYCTTLFDFYGLGEGFPRQSVPPNASSAQKAQSVETPFHADIAMEMGEAFPPQRFLPYFQMHEFEGLLFSDCSAFSRGIYRPDLQPAFQAIRDQFETPEEIDDSPITAPSKRVRDLIPNYEKPLLGTLAALEIGLEAIRVQCPHFNAWLTRLEQAAEGAIGP